MCTKPWVGCTGELGRCRANLPAFPSDANANKQWIDWALGAENLLHYAFFLVGNKIAFTKLDVPDALEEISYEASAAVWRQLVQCSLTHKAKYLEYFWVKYDLNIFWKVLYKPWLTRCLRGEAGKNNHTKPHTHKKNPKAHHFCSECSSDKVSEGESKLGRLQATWGKYYFPVLAVLQCTVQSRCASSWEALGWLHRWCGMMWCFTLMSV